MSIIDATKEKLDAQIESWEKELETEKAKLKEKQANAKLLSNLRMTLKRRSRGI